MGKHVCQMDGPTDIINLCILLMTQAMDVSNTHEQATLSTKGIQMGKTVTAIDQPLSVPSDIPEPYSKLAVYGPKSPYILRYCGRCYDSTERMSYIHYYYLAQMMPLAPTSVSVP